MSGLTKGEVKRCEVCDWPLAESEEKGCVPGNCSYRPELGSDEYRRIERRRKELAGRTTKETVNRVIAERVMGWEMRETPPRDGKTETVWFDPATGHDCEVWTYDPSENAAQFNEAFAKAGEELIEKFLIAWVDAQEGEAWLDGPDDAIHRWVKAPLEQKARALAEAITRTEE